MSIFLEHPEVAVTKALTPKMLECLRAVIASNGGGVSIYDWSRSVIKGLMDRHMIQGKSGDPYRFVHTRIGLEYWRKSIP